EVHTVGADGSTTAVDPASHIFHTGDRFVVLYRPSMPGRMEVYNINPTGQRTRIDTTTMAAGQLAVLGTYQFSRTTGDESLRLVISPCSSPQLLVAIARHCECLRHCTFFLWCRPARYLHRAGDARCEDPRHYQGRRRGRHCVRARSGVSAGADRGARHAARGEHRVPPPVGRPHRAV